MSLYQNPDLFWIDCETTGLDPDVNEIISLAILTHDENGEAHIFSKHFLPVGPVSAEAARVNGYTPEKWAELGAVAWTLEDLNEIKALVWNKIPAGCNVSFDLAFVASYFKRAERDVPSWSHRKCDVQAMAMPLYVAGKIKSTSLKTLAATFDLGEQDHTAEGDVMLALQVFEKLCEAYGIVQE